MADPTALNREFTKYDQVRKTHTYRLAEHDSDQFDDAYKISTLDLGPYLHGDAKDKARFAQPLRAEDYWPRAAYEREFRRLALAHEALFKPIAQAMFQGLGCDPHVYDRKLTGTNFGLRLNYYPPLTAAQERSGAGRLLGHEDVDLFTILPVPRIDGLQVWNHRSG